MPTVEVTKLHALLKERKMSQVELHELIPKVNNGETLTRYIISEIASGKRKNYNIRTAILIANALEVPIDDIID